MACWLGRWNCVPEFFFEFSSPMLIGCALLMNFDPFPEWASSGGHLLYVCARGDGGPDSKPLLGR
eukprot:scaffold173526_cov25-Prasinocladus_malaysianus.AAC.1